MEWADRKSASDEDPRLTKLFDQHYVYTKRMEPVLQLAEDLRALEAETSAVWGDEANESLKAIHGCIGEMWGAYTCFFEEKRQLLEVDERKETENLKDCRQVMHGLANDSDVFWCKVQDAVQEVEKAYRPHLKQRRFLADVAKWVKGFDDFMKK